MSDLNVLQQQLGGLSPQRKWYRHWSYRSAVSLILREASTGLQVLMIERARREGDPWSGQMGFPGGRQQLQDEGSLATALRETHEEIGWQLEQCARPLGRLSDLRARPQRLGRPLIVSPFVFGLESEPVLQTNHEVAAVVWLPIEILLDQEQRQTMLMRRRGRRRQLPYYQFEGRRVWGLSLMMLDELMQLVNCGDTVSG